ncbi:acyl carrier protein [Actinomadura fibrosa]|uniref:Acyl carrier protein n=1 Tax=Actinomadura fibrosa TaxID=111802 RepID=A0ABW2XU55_9ACTN|nr:acyl carrier protein [Actinomadura fibrosa]
MSREDIARRVRDLVGDLVPAGARRVGPADRLVEDLGFDSVAVLELALALEVEFDLQEIDEARTVDLATVGDIEALIAKAVSEPEYGT